MLARVLVLAGILNLSLAVALAVPLLAAALFQAVAAYLLIGRDAHNGEPKADDLVHKNPFLLSEVLRFGAILGVVMLAAGIANSLWGSGGLMAVAAISGLADVDAMTLSVANMGPATAAGVAAILVTIGVNTIAKSIYAWIAGEGASACCCSALTLRRWPWRWRAIFCYHPRNSDGDLHDRYAAPQPGTDGGHRILDCRGVPPFLFRLRLALGWLVLLSPLIALAWFMAFRNGPPDVKALDAASIVALAALGVGVLLASFSITVNWHRRILLGEKPRRLGWVRLDGVVWRYVGGFLLILIVLGLYGGAAFGITTMAAPALSTQLGPAAKPWGSPSPSSSASPHSSPCTACRAGSPPSPWRTLTIRSAPPGPPPARTASPIWASPSGCCSRWQSPEAWGRGFLRPAIAAAGVGEAGGFRLDRPDHLDGDVPDRERGGKPLQALGPRGD